MNIPAPIFAANLDDLIKVVIVVAIGLGWLIKLIASKNQAQVPPPVRRPPRPVAPRDDKIKNEIEVFLQEVTGRKPAARPRDPQEARDVVVVVEQPPRRPAPAPARLAPATQPPPAKSSARQTLTTVGQAPAVPAEAASIRPGGMIAGRKGPGSGDLGSAVKEHLSQYMDSTRIEKQVQQDLKHAVDETVQAHLGRFTAESQAQGKVGSARSAAEAPHPIVGLLQNPQGVRQAVLIKEILERPSARGRRKRR